MALRSKVDDGRGLILGQQFLNQYCVIYGTLCEYVSRVTNYFRKRIEVSGVSQRIKID